MEKDEAITVLANYLGMGQKHTDATMLAITALKNCGTQTASTNTGMAAEAQICQEIVSYLKKHGYHSHKGMCAGTLELAIKNRVVGKLRHA